MKNLRLMVAPIVIGLAVPACSENDTRQPEEPVDVESPVAAIPPATEESLIGREPVNDDPPELPEHAIERSSLAMKDGQRVQIDVQNEIGAQECAQLIDRYRADGAPDGQVSVRKLTPDGTLFPYCVENFDGRGVTFNEGMF